MESIAASSAIASSPSSFSFSHKRSARRRQSLLPIASKNWGDEAGLNWDSENTSRVPFLSNRAPISPLPKDEAMGLVLSAAAGRGWTTGSGMEDPPIPLIRRFSHSPGPSAPDLRVVECAWPLPATSVASGPLVPSTLMRIRTAPCLFSVAAAIFRYKGDMPFNYIDADDDQDIFSFL
ncbi:hypothetical protein OPV22_009715 [Ensete ventricosum]|uniref:Uncharacterized protein n=1 Tax=Ensete ventricosum TaxID=4639 RepID=A0AAV8R5T9_ENSVE|nr:hypothetical protein OPV22_009715 [Ensete ventricosum]